MNVYFDEEDNLLVAVEPAQSESDKKIEKHLYAAIKNIPYLNIDGSGTALQAISDTRFVRFCTGKPIEFFQRTTEKLTELVFRNTASNAISEKEAVMEPQVEPQEIKGLTI